MEFMSTNRAQQIQTDIVTKAAVLNHLRAGQTDSAAKLLEGLLDGDILAAGYLVRDGHTLNKNTIIAVEKERLAREVSGYESPNAAVAAEMKDAFQKISPTAEKH